MPLTVEIVTAERVVSTELGVDILIAPGSEGMLGILPKHAPLMTTLKPGELVFRRGSEEESFAISGGFLEVRQDQVTILADQAEAAGEIDVERAEAARARAEERVRRAREQGVSDVDMARAAAALQRSLVRLRVAERRRPRSGAAGGRPRPIGQ
ncbi:F0F1 ATP synthase subunit epsilon [bacterium]|jgi:F-type H+-transporting ATPase subunit epsilon|nr:F0F1 ATP synthase subunit epsilon [bacterium]